MYSCKHKFEAHSSPKTQHSTSVCGKVNLKTISVKTTYNSYQLHFGSYVAIEKCIVERRVARWLCADCSYLPEHVYEYCAHNCDWKLSDPKAQKHAAILPPWSTRRSDRSRDSQPQVIRGDEYFRSAAARCKNTILSLRSAR